MANEALLFYSQMKSASPGTKADPYTYSSTLKACTDTRNFKMVRRVFDTMRKRNVVAWNTLVSWLGGEYVTDLFVVSSAIFMYAELGCLEYARKIFDHCSERNTEIWNTMIGAYVQNNSPIEAIDLFFQAVNSEVAILDEVTFLSVLTACSQMQQLELAGQLHAFIIKHLRLMPVILLNATIVMYSRCNSVDMSFKIFHKMPERDVVSWNTMISAFVQNGLDDEALMLVYEMQKQRFMIDSVTVTALLSASSNLRNPDIGKQTHAYLIRHDIQFEGMDSYLIDMYAKSGSVRIAERVFKKDYSRDRDQATWNSMIAGYTQNGLSEEAFFVFRQMLEQNLIPNAVTLASVLPACNIVGNIDMGKQLHGFSIRHYLAQNVFVGSALIDMYSKCGAVTYAENVFAGSHEKNSVTYTTMILGYGQHGMGERALSLFHSMQKSGIAPDAITLVAVLSACSYAGLVNEGLLIYDSMKREYNIKPLTAHYCCIADIIHKHFELGKIVAGKLLELEAANGKRGYHVLLSNMYAEEGKWENVDNVRKQMREKGLRKETGCSWIDISGFLNCFVSRNQNHPQGDEIYDILEELTVKMKDTGYRPSLNSSLDAILEPYD
ncbi:pentatricopeptide repeat-containing protein At3g22150, chloroplastic-like [Malus domestica]|uniref:pentatricopeptide repeat-containing protein At3g22150, chloroplastic-like n=1 Tax=Malus domestica TaxID=3750 RepID=UPI003974B671